MIKAYAAETQGGELKAFEYKAEALGNEQVEIKVDYCGVCHSDLSMLDNEWGMTQYPFVPGHEVVGIISEIGKNVKTLKVGQRVGLGWYAGSCMHCDLCMSGNHNLCLTAEATIIGRHGGFADKVIAKEEWVITLPEAIDPAKAGPLFCGGITVFNPFVQQNIKPTDRVGIIGIGGLGHMAIQFAKAWGCDVTAFSSSRDKEEETRKLGAHHFIDSRDTESMKKATNSLDMILCTANADLNWEAYISLLRPKGKLHFVGVAPSPVAAHAFSLIGLQKSIAGSPLGSPVTTKQMLEFSARHKIEPIVEFYKFAQINDAMERLKSGKARYRIVLEH
ncbi:MAG: NAD(P)-dependent alcohol dehydrogenase [Candidatus Caenarcaniphilales bacterium]|nr:NAD(P)-dependent alcohol dehydrogenase [Candidatus Caenarcaniphilales bacterium]